MFSFDGMFNIYEIDHSREDLRSAQNDFAASSWLVVRRVRTMLVTGQVVRVIRMWSMPLEVIGGPSMLTPGLGKVFCVFSTEWITLIYRTVQQV